MIMKNDTNRMGVLVIAIFSTIFITSFFGLVNNIRLAIDAKYTSVGQRAAAAEVNTTQTGVLLSKDWCSTTYVDTGDSKNGSVLRATNRTWQTGQTDVRIKNCQLIGENPIATAFNELFDCVKRHVPQEKKTRFYNKMCKTPIGKEQFKKVGQNSFVPTPNRKSFSAATLDGWVGIRNSINNGANNTDTGSVNSGWLSIQPSENSDINKTIDTLNRSLNGGNTTRNNSVFTMQEPAQIPVACKNELDKFLKEKKRGLSQIQKKASRDDRNQCVYKGVANCVLTPTGKTAFSEYEKCFGQEGCEAKLKKLKDKLYNCYPKNQSTSKPQNSPTSGATGQGSTPQHVPSYGAPVGNYGNQGQFPGGAMGNMGALGGGQQMGQQYDPCKDPSYTSRQNMGIFSSFMFGVTCALRPNNSNNKQESNNQQNRPTCVLSADKSTVTKGESVKLSWRSSGATTARLEGAKMHSVETSGSKTLQPQKTTTYTLTVSGKGGQTSCSKTVTVRDVGKPSITCSPTKVQKGASAQITWSCPAGTTLKASNFNAKEDSGSLPVSVDAKQEFTVTCSGTAQQQEIEKTASCTIDIISPQLEIIAYPTELKLGERARVSWAAVDVQSCTVTGPGSFSYSDMFATVLVTPFPKDNRFDGPVATYTINCTDAWGGSYSKDVTITLTDTPPAPVEETHKRTPTPPQDEVTTTVRTSLNPNECPHFTKYHKVGDTGGEVPKIQIFLKDQGLYYGALDGTYNKAVDEAVRAFQAKYANEILRPWGLTAPTGRWYKTTRKKANELAGCAEGAVVLDDGTVVH